MFDITGYMSPLQWCGGANTSFTKSNAIVNGNMARNNPTTKRNKLFIFKRDFKKGKVCPPHKLS